jgi:hypothetical protein
MHNNITTSYEEINALHISNTIKKFLFEICYTLCNDYPGNRCNFFFFDNAQHTCYYHKGDELFQPDNSENIIYCYKIQLGHQAHVITNESTTDIQPTQYNEYNIFNKIFFFDNITKLDIVFNMLVMIWCSVMILFYYILKINFILSYNIKTHLSTYKTDSNDEKNIVIAVPV